MARSLVPLRVMVLGAALAALGLALPVAFHAAGLGSTFLPMLLPLLLAGFLLPAGWAAGIGAAVPLVSAVLTGMPPVYPPVALVMSAEGAVLAGAAALVFHGSRPKVWPALAAAIVAGRATMVLLTWVLAPLFGLPSALAALVSAAHGVPGIILQVVVVPIVVRRLAARPSLLLSGGEEHAPPAPTTRSSTRADEERGGTSGYRGRRLPSTSAAGSPGSSPTDSEGLSCRQ